MAVTWYSWDILLINIHWISMEPSLLEFPIFYDNWLLFPQEETSWALISEDIKWESSSWTSREAVLIPRLAIVSIRIAENLIHLTVIWFTCYMFSKSLPKADRRVDNSVVLVNGVPWPSWFTTIDRCLECRARGSEGHNAGWRRGTELRFVLRLRHVFVGGSTSIFGKIHCICVNWKIFDCHRSCPAPKRRLYATI